MSTPQTSTNRSEKVEPSLSKGESSRATILMTAAKLATIKGLEGLSIGDLATEVGMSKSGLYAHFKSKEDLELAIIETAAEIFHREVIDPATNATAGVQRLRTLIDAFLEHLERRVFPGGCFFAAVAMELDTRPGPARDRVQQVQQNWHSNLMQCFLDARATGEIDSNADVMQATFEIGAMLLAANYVFVMMNDRGPLLQAKKGTENVLARMLVSAAPKNRRHSSEKNRV